MKLAAELQERSGIKKWKNPLRMKPKLDAAQERRGIAENKRQRPGKRESARETMTGVEILGDWIYIIGVYKEESQYHGTKGVFKGRI